jgi:DnaJ-class molecular chaperone
MPDDFDWRISDKNPLRCPDCRGFGYFHGTDHYGMEDDETCGRCHGRGRLNLLEGIALAAAEDSELRT